MKCLFWVSLVSLGAYGYFSLLNTVGALTGVN